MTRLGMFVLRVPRTISHSIVQKMWMFAWGNVSMDQRYVICENVEDFHFGEMNRMFRGSEITSFLQMIWKCNWIEWNIGLHSMELEMLVNWYFFSSDVASFTKISLTVQLFIFTHFISSHNASMDAQYKSEAQLFGRAVFERERKEKNRFTIEFAKMFVH